MSLSVEDYFLKIESIISKYAGFLEQINLEYEKLTPNSGYLKGSIKIRGTTLFFFEYIKVSGRKIIREKYRYHWQKSSGELIKRWDNAPHHKEVSTFPYHIDTKDGVKPSKEVDIDYVLSKIFEEL